MFSFVFVMKGVPVFLIGQYKKTTIKGSVFYLFTTSKWKDIYLTNRFHVAVRLFNNRSHADDVKMS